MDRRTFLKVGSIGAAQVAAVGSTLMASQTFPTGFYPTEGTVGQLINFFGPRLGRRLADHSVRFTDGYNTAFLLPRNLARHGLKAKLMAFPPAMWSGQAEIVLGDGHYDNPSNMPPELSLNLPIFSWVGNGGPRYQSSQSFQLGYYNNSCPSWGYVDGLTGQLVVDIVIPYDANCCAIAPAGSKLALRVLGATANNAFEFDFQIKMVNEVPLSSYEVGNALSALLVSAFQSNFGITMNCLVSDLGMGHTSISIASPNYESFVSGAANFEIINNVCDGSISSGSFGGSIPDSVGSAGCSSFAGSCPQSAFSFSPFFFE